MQMVKLAVPRQRKKLSLPLTKALRPSMDIEAQIKMMMDLLNNPAFQQGANEYFRMLHQQGTEVASKFWSASPKAAMFPEAGQVMERMADFYSAMGFVPLAKFEE